MECPLLSVSIGLDGSSLEYVEHQHLFAKHHCEKWWSCSRDSNNRWEEREVLYIQLMCAKGKKYEIVTVGLYTGGKEN